jgi:hypothetical protein
MIVFRVNSAQLSRLRSGESDGLARHHETGDHELAAHHAHTAQGHLHHATHHAAEAAKSHAEHYGKKTVAAILRVGQEALVNAIFRIRLSSTIAFRATGR